MKVISDKRQKLIDAKKNSPLVVGEKVWVKYEALHSYVDKTRSHSAQYCIILEIADKIKVRRNDNSVYKDVVEISIEDIEERDLAKIGANPFEESNFNVRPVAFSFSSIISTLNVLDEELSGIFAEPIMNGIQLKRANWNPFVYDKAGVKQYYQRPLVWGIEEKQLLLDSLYNGIDCGKILVRKRGWKELERLANNGETELAFNDIVDGKQRLHAIKDFLQGKFADSQGNYYGDLSFHSQRRLTENMLFSYAEMSEETKDEDVIRQFLKLNFTGIPQSKEHIEFVKSLQSKV